MRPTRGGDSLTKFVVTQSSDEIRIERHGVGYVMVVRASMALKGMITSYESQANERSSRGTYEWELDDQERPILKEHKWYRYTSDSKDPKPVFDMKISEVNLDIEIPDERVSVPDSQRGSFEKWLKSREGDR